MKKLNLETLKERADSITSENIMNSITGGVENGCHVIATVPSKGGDLIIYTK